MKRSFVAASTVLATMSLLISPVSSRATAPSTETELTASDFAGFRHFGSAVAIDGDTAVVGVPFDSDAGFNAGAACVFIRSGSTWTQQAKLTAADASSGSEFGSAVAISGDTIVVGAPSTVSGGVNAGAAYVFVRSGSTWTQQTKLAPTDAIGNDQFGASVAVERDTLAIGAIGTGLAFGDEGAVYVYGRSGGVWSQQARLSSDEPAPGDEFGFSVALNNGTLAVGSPFDDDLSLADTGAVYVFTASGTTWNFQAELTAADAATSDNLGWSVALNGDTIVTGAPQRHSGADFAGAAYVFVRSGTAWSQQSLLVADDPAAFDYFGYSTAVNNNTAIVGSVFDNSFASHGGSAYIFTRAGSVWSQDSEFSASDIANDYHFGYAVAVSGSTILVGAPLGFYFQDGAAYVYEVSSSNTAPVANPQSITTAEDTAAAVTLTGSDAEGDPLTFAVVTGPTNGTLSGTSPNLIYTPNPNANGSDSFTFKANDGQLDSTPATVSISITPVNDAPVANSQSVTTLEDNAVTITLTGGDVEGSPLTFAVLTGPTKGTLSGTPPNLTYTPNANANGSDSFTFSVNDGTVDSLPATVSISVTPVNDGPTISDIPDQMMAKNSTTDPIAFTVSDVDNDPDGLAVSGSSSDQTLVPDGNISFGGSGANRTITVTPLAKQSGTVTITVTVSDGLQTASTSFTLTVTHSNHPPKADPTATVTQLISPNNVSATSTLDGSRSNDPDNDPLTYTWQAVRGTIGTGVVGHVSLALGTHAITLVVSDGSLSDSAAIAIRVITATEATHQVMDDVGNANISHGKKTSLLAVLREAARLFDRGRMDAGVKRLREFQKNVQVNEGKKVDPATVAALVGEAQNIIDALPAR
ncbi:MAG TPA: Ig-like domain-containing protein [Candidatus Angelobacter sp.]|nr:Ig-like domain-containing protein [Candidatus Angelobacter sp.]